MKSITKKILVALIGVIALSCAVGCSSGEPIDSSSVPVEAPQGEAYEYTFDKPFAGTPDEYMTIDGKLDEDVWQNKKWVGNKIDDQSWKATTYFTDKGVYIGMKAEDETMRYVSRYTSRSAFRIYICKTGTQTYNINSTAYHESRCLIFECDPYYCRSKNRVPYYYKTNVEGELNSGETCTMTAELFLTWKDLYYTEDELGENGYPEDIQMYISYEGETGEVLGTCLWREDCYFHFGKDGYKTLSEYEGDFGNEIYTSTDMWKVDDEGNYYTTAGRSQILWYNAEATDFMFEARLQPLLYNDDGTRINFRGSAVNGSFGLISRAAVSDSSINTTDNKTAYSVYSTAANDFVSKANGSRIVKPMTYKQIDSLHWANRIGLRSEVVTSTYAEDSIVLRIIKKGSSFYYFYGDTFWKSEIIPSMEGEVCCGVFTNQGVAILDYRFVDYSNDAEALKTTLSEYVYFIETPRTDYGSVTTSSETVAKGKSVTITFTPTSVGSVLTQVSKNGQDVYEEVVSAMNSNGQYTFTPTEDTTVVAKFSTFDEESLVRTVVEFKYGDTIIKNTNCVICGDGNKLLYYSLSPNTAGYIVVNLPKEGTYEVDGRTFEVNGQYSLSATISGYHDISQTFTLNDETTSTDIKGNPESVKENKTYTHRVSATKNTWGAVKVNNVNVSGSSTLSYNASTGNYYGSGVDQWFTTMVGEDFDLKVNLKLTDIASNNDSLSGIQITNGKYLIVLKTHLNNGRGLMIATGTNYSTTTKEIALSNFGWTSAKDVTASAKGSGVVDFRVIKSGNVIYIFNGKGKLMCYLNENGVNIVDSSVISWSAGSLNGVNSDIKNFFAAGTNVVVGVKSYGTVNSEYGMDYAKTLSDEAKAKISYASFDIETGKDIKFRCSLKDGYAKGETINLKLEVQSKDRNAVLQVILETENGTKVLEGDYDSTNKFYSYIFVADGTPIKVKAYVLTECEMGWSSDWTDFVPEKDNTQL